MVMMECLQANVYNLKKKNHTLTLFVLSPILNIYSQPSFTHLKYFSI
jgi:hypothetical protein